MKILNSLSLGVAIIALASVVGLFLYFNNQFESVNSQITSLKSSTANRDDSEQDTQKETQEIDLSDYATKEYVNEVVEDLGSSQVTASAPTTTTTTTTKTKEQKTIVPITGGFSTQSQEWVDIPGTEFYLDLANDYGEDAVVYWEAFIREQNDNGSARVRLYDSTHDIVVVNSEIYTSNTASTLITSANLAIWRGKNLYKVQIMSQLGDPVFFDSGRLVITY